MPTLAHSFPALLPPFPGWAAIPTGPVDIAGAASAAFIVDAADATEAERRVLSWVGYLYDNDLDGAVATATPLPSRPRTGTDVTGRFTVTIVFARP